MEGLRQAAFRAGLRVSRLQFEKLDTGNAAEDTAPVEHDGPAAGIVEP